jgi:GC-rich sequence DNA-binding factor
LTRSGSSFSLLFPQDLQRRAENRRRRRARAADAARARGLDPAFESSGESEGEIESFRSNRRELLKTAEAVMADADEEYSSLELVKKRLEGWKRSFPATYRRVRGNISIILWG